MKAVSSKELKSELKNTSPEELIALCLRLARFKKENKELLTYLLLECDDEESYKQSVKDEIDSGFSSLNTNTYYFAKKGVRKILRETKKYIRYSAHKQTEVELLIYFCKKLSSVSVNGVFDLRFSSIFLSQKKIIQKKILVLHEDLQYDFSEELNEIAESFVI